MGKAEYRKTIKTETVKSAIVKGNIEVTTIF